jgi:hypothetical protein
MNRETINPKDEQEWAPDLELQSRLLRHCLVTIRGCWEWVGYRMTNGYGKMSYKGQRAKWVHRLAFRAFKGPIEGIDVCHSCDNPPCFSPAHLFSGTAKDNAADMMAKGRHPFVFEKQKTHCKRGHPLSGENLRIHVNGHRQCRACLRLTTKLREIQNG